MKKVLFYLALFGAFLIKNETTNYSRQLSAVTKNDGCAHLRVLATALEMKG
jgi:hypothetical protein